MRKIHAQHNLDLCLDLISKGGYSDWVTTTAFYSAVHFVEHALFPLIENSVEYTTFDDYYSTKQFVISKHKVKSNLVFKYINHVGAIYKGLLDECNNARYIDYQVTPNNAIEA